MPVELVGFLFDFSACLQAIAKFDGSLRNVIKRAVSCVRAAGLVCTSNCLLSSLAEHSLVSTEVYAASHM
jgi:hypothetical protein